jgi:hypothetical protein
MPNHIHMILKIVGANDYSPLRDDGLPVGANDYSPLRDDGLPVGANDYSPLRDGDSPVRDDGLPVRAKGTSRTLGSIVRGYKIGVTKRVNELRGTPGMKLWQRNYYEHVVRNEDDYSRIAEYIENNPLEWDLDDYYLR